MEIQEQKIIGVSISNFMRVETIAIRPNGENVVIGGPNDAGKTSVLDAIASAIGGTRLVPAVPIRHGSSQSITEVELTDIVVRRTCTASGSNLTVKWRDNKGKAGSPQKLLDSLITSLTFDPLEFSRMDAIRQIAVLKRFCAIDVDVLEARMKDVYTKRTEAGNRFKQQQAALAAMQVHGDAPDDCLSTEDLMAELERRQDVNRGIERAAEAINEADEELANCMASVSDQKLVIADLEAKLANARQELEVRQGLVAEQKKVCEDLKARPAAQPADTQEIAQQIREAAEINRKVHENQRHAEEMQRLAEFRAALEALEAEYQQLQKERDAAFSESAMPVEGLTFNDREVFLGGVPLSQIGTANRIRLSASIGILCNPKLRVMFVRDASLMDRETMNELLATAQQYGIQLWLEVVGDREDVTVLIEDGKAARVRSAPAGIAAGAQDRLAAYQPPPGIPPPEMETNTQTTTEPEPEPENYGASQDIGPEEDPWTSQF